jgi:hypothetical protein
VSLCLLKAAIYGILVKVFFNLLYMKKSFFLIGFLILAVPILAAAAEFKVDSNVPAGTTIDDNLYLAGGNPVVAGDINGDLLVAGGNVLVTGKVSGDIAAIGGNISIIGEVSGDVRVFGGSIYVDSKIGGEVISFGGQVIFGPNAVIEKDLIGGGGEIRIDSATSILGIQKLFVPEERPEELREKAKEFFIGAYLMFIFYTLVAYLVVAAILWGIFPNVIRGFTKAALKDGMSFWKYLGIGFVILFFVPILSFFLFLSLFGALAGVILLLIYALYLVINMVLAGILFGTLMKKWIVKGKPEPDWLWGLGGVFALHVIGQIPVIGWFICFVFFLYSLGALATGEWKIYREAKV